MKRNKVLIIAGPTASGKSGYAKKIALDNNGVIINADSMQVYKILNIITARPSKEDEKEIPHKLYGYLEPSVNCNASLWRKDALQEIDKAINENKLPIVVGGTGLYIKSLIEGLSPIPEISNSIREAIRQRMQTEGSNSLHKELHPDDQKRLHKNDSQRICRALEVFQSTNKSMVYWNKQENIGIKKDLDFDYQIIMPENNVLKEKINKRFDQMIKDGAIDEVRSLMSLNLNNNLPAMKAIGVPPLIEYLKGNIDLEEAIKQGKLQTKQYAKRQKTWFKKTQAKVINL